MLIKIKLTFPKTRLTFGMRKTSCKTFVQQAFLLFRVRPSQGTTQIVKSQN